ncbi:unnamed protein product [Prorocentrum cordatum]|uniref:RRM domain-containing protein n=1 Tax=Prorocentrum cordatum TaxID=2364126 RepID=A0ABN9Y7E6_9DINO|nr:unnamed protein product [Polarella glacialis]
MLRGAGKQPRHPELTVEVRSPMAPQRADAGVLYYTGIGPCVVKNSFLHFADGEEQPPCLFRRERSEPCLPQPRIGDACPACDEQARGGWRSACRSPGGDAPLAELPAAGSASAPPRVQAELPASAGRAGGWPEWGSGVVTVMIRQLPRQYTQLMFLEELNRRGFEGLFDFVYIPFDGKKDANVGYGFVNFTELEHAERFRSEFDGMYLAHPLRNHGKPLRIHPAAMQGYEANYDHFEKSKASHSQDMKHGPLFLDPGLGAAAPAARQPAEVGTAEAQVRDRCAALPPRRATRPGVTAPGPASRRRRR